VAVVVVVLDAASTSIDADVVVGIDRRLLGLLVLLDGAGLVAGGDGQACDGRGDEVEAAVTPRV